MITADATKTTKLHCYNVMKNGGCKVTYSKHRSSGLPFVTNSRLGGLTFDQIEQAVKEASRFHDIGLKAMPDAYDTNGNLVNWSYALVRKSRVENQRIHFDCVFFKELKGILNNMRDKSFSEKLTENNRSAFLTRLNEEVCDTGLLVDLDLPDTQKRVLRATFHFDAEYVAGNAVIKHKLKKVLERKICKLSMESFGVSPCLLTWSYKEAGVLEISYFKGI